MDLPHYLQGPYNYNSVHACTCARVQVFVGQLQFHLNSYPHLHSPHLCLRVHHHLYHPGPTMYLTVHRPILVPWTYVGLPWTYMYMYLHRPTLDLRTYIGLPWTDMYLHKPTLDLLFSEKNCYMYLYPRQSNIRLG